MVREKACPSIRRNTSQPDQTGGSFLLIRPNLTKKHRFVSYCLCAPARRRGFVETRPRAIRRQANGKRRASATVAPRWLAAGQALLAIKVLLAESWPGPDIGLRGKGRGGSFPGAFLRALVANDHVYGDRFPPDTTKRYRKKARFVSGCLRAPTKRSPLPKRDRPTKRKHGASASVLPRRLAAGQALLAIRVLLAESQLGPDIGPRGRRRRVLPWRLPTHPSGD